jgi:hypothetical protein
MDCDERGRAFPSVLCRFPSTEFVLRLLKAGISLPNLASNIALVRDERIEA